MSDPSHFDLEVTVSSITNTGTAIQKTFNLLDKLSQSHLPLSLQELCKLTGLAKPTAHRILCQLETSELVNREPTTRTYTVGTKLCSLAVDVLSARARLSDVKIIMQMLVNDINETVNLAILDGSEVVYIERVECKERIRINLHAGSRVALHVSSTGKLLAAHLPKQLQKTVLDNLDLKKHTEFTITEVCQLKDELIKIRERGYGTSNQESLLGMIGVSVPVRAADGRVIAALALHAVAARMSMEQGVSCVPRLEAAAQKIGKLLDLRDSSN